MKKRILSSLLAASMMVATVPAYAFAIDDGADMQETESAIMLPGAGTEESPSQVGTADQLIEAVKTGGYIQLTANIELSSPLAIPEDTTVTLDLNNHDITVPQVTGGSSLYAIHNYGVLTIEDSSDSSDGSISSRGV